MWRPSGCGLRIVLGVTVLAFVAVCVVVAVYFATRSGRSMDGSTVLDIRVATFNMDRKTVRYIGEKSFKEWLCSDGGMPDVLVLATQETGTSNFEGQKKELKAKLETHCGWKFHDAAINDIGQVGLFVFHRSVLELPYSGDIPIGFRWWRGRYSKGMAFLRFKYDATYYTFAGVHLAAHEGVKYMAKRKKRMQSIEEMLLQLPPHAPTFLGYKPKHVIVIAGDFNTRATADSCGNNEVYKKNGSFEDWFKCDELSNRPPTLLHGFRECEVLFPPTFKRSGDGYEIRTPSWTDRIIVHFSWNSAKRCDANSYRRVRLRNEKNQLISDHDAVVLSNVKALLGFQSTECGVAESRNPR